MKQKIYQTVKEALEVMLTNSEIVDNTGAIKFTTKDKKKHAYVFVRNNNIYAVYSSLASPDYITRLYQAGEITADSLEIIKRRFGTNLKDPQISGYIRDSHMVPEKVLENITQDFFLEIFCEILQWEHVSTEWRKNETTGFLKITSKPYEKILEVIETRNQYLSTVAATLNVEQTELPKLAMFVKNDELFDEQTPPIFHQLRSVANKKTSLQESKALFGLTLFRSVQALYILWEKDIVNVYLGEYLLPSNPNAEKIEKPKIANRRTPKNKPVAEEEITIEPISVENFLQEEDKIDDSPVPASSDSDANREKLQRIKDNAKEIMENYQHPSTTDSIETVTQPDEPKPHEIVAEIPEIKKAIKEPKIVETPPIIVNKTPEQPTKEKDMNIPNQNFDDVDEIIAAISTKLRVKRTEMQTAEEKAQTAENKVAQAEEVVKHYKQEKINAEKDLELLQAEYSQIVSSLKNF